MATVINECENCGFEWECGEERTIEICSECCDHENTEQTLGGGRCRDCGKTF